MSTMEDAYRRDYRAKCLCDEAARALDAIAQDEATRLNDKLRDQAEKLSRELKATSASVVRAWD